VSEPRNIFKSHPDYLSDRKKQRLQQLIKGEKKLLLKRAFLQTFHVEAAPIPFNREHFWIANKISYQLPSKPQAEI
jgi:hypothetical protein